ncbi:MAG: S-layer protein [Labilithrix sp.]|nr:S-layer protein [Labilithrix sp.]
MNDRYRSRAATLTAALLGTLGLVHCGDAEAPGASADASPPSAEEPCTEGDASAPGPEAATIADPLRGLRYLDVRAAPYGAKGDGKTDDTAAFQRALDAASSFPATGGYRPTTPGHGGLVFAPAGEYLIAGTLRIPPYVSLVGTTPAPASTATPWSRHIGTVLLSTANAGKPDGAPFLAMNSSSTLEGITIFYPNQTDTNPPVAYPWTIRGRELPISLVNVTLVNAFRGVDVASVASGRHFFRGVYGQPLETGINVDKSLDVGRLENVHFTPIWHAEATSPALAFQRSAGTGISIERGDWEVLADIELRGYATGILLTTSTCASLCGGGLGQMSRVTLDTDVGIEITNSSQVNYFVRDLTWAPSWKGRRGIGVWHPVGLPAYLTLSNANMQGPMTQAVLWEGDGTFTMAGGKVAPWAAGSAALAFAAGRGIVQRVAFEKGTRRAVAVTGAAVVIANGNQLQGNTIAGKITGTNTP